MGDIINPVQLPDGSAVEFSGGDVKHFSQNDELGHAAVSTSTRNLAHRDNVLGNKLNEVIAMVNNREQYVPLPIVRTLVPPSALETVTNYRIPNGFEARVLNAKVVAAPPGTPVRLTVQWASGFGATTGTSVVDTLDEATAGTEFFGAGEFIIQLNNTGSTTAEVVACVILTMRPVGTTAGGLIGPGSVGPVGPIGPQGGTGGQGLTGSPGPAGSPGMVWRSRWASGSNYIKNDVTSYSFGGSAESSYIALLPNTNVPPPAPDLAPSATWDLVAKGGSGGSGSSSSTALNWRSNWVSNPGQPYVLNDLVSYTTGSIVTSWVAGSIPTATLPPSVANGWTQFGSSQGVDFGQTTLFGDVAMSADYVAGTLGSYTSSGTAGGLYPLAFSEIKTHGPVGSSLLLKYSQQHYFKGTVTVTLPGVAKGASVGWSTAAVPLVAVLNGSQTSGINPIVVKASGSSYQVISPSANPQPLILNAVGFTVI